jgi:hypothetical protein
MAKDFILIGNEELGIIVTRLRPKGIEKYPKWAIFCTSKIEECTDSNWVSLFRTKQSAMTIANRLLNMQVQVATRNFLEELKGQFVSKEDLFHKIREHFGIEKLLIVEKTYYYDDEYNDYCYIFNVELKDFPKYDAMCGDFYIYFTLGRNDMIYVTDIVADFPQY